MHFLLIFCCCLVAKLCLTLCNPIDCRPLGSSVHGISQERTVEWVAIFFSRVSSQPTNLHLLCGRQILQHSVTWEAPLTSTSNQ